MLSVLWLGYFGHVCLLDAIVELHAMDENTSNEFLIRKRTWIIDVINPDLIHDLYFVYVVEEFITFN